MGDPGVVVLGVGNTLMQDDGVGIHAVQLLADRYELPANVRVVDGGVAGLRLLGEIATADYLIIVDAVRCGGVPGSIYCLGQADLRPRHGPFVSAHEVGIAELLAAAEFSGRLPETQIVGVEPLDAETIGLQLSSPLLCALPRVVAAIVDTLHAHGVELKEKSKLGVQPRSVGAKSGQRAVRAANEESTTVLACVEVSGEGLKGEGEVERGSGSTGRAGGNRCTSYRSPMTSSRR